MPFSALLLSGHDHTHESSVREYGGNVEESLVQIHDMPVLALTPDPYGPEVDISTDKLKRKIDFRLVWGIAMVGRHANLSPVFIPYDLRP